ncbi:MAG: septum formation inhibitor Maf, partial [Psychromonas sp.]|nr:septum formation inhibitor Maf [Psychromonas sp.]
MKKIILASTSPFRAQILKKLGVSFKAKAPECDEMALEGESHRALVMRLSESKARSLANSESNTLIIGSDQVADLDGE